MSQNKINLAQNNYFQDLILDVLFSQNLTEIKIKEIKKNSFYDYVIICTAKSIAQMNPVVKKLKVKLNTNNIIFEGYNSNWLLIIFKGYLIQIFTEESRKYYNIEDIYFDSPTIAKFG